MPFLPQINEFKACILQKCDKHRLIFGRNDHLVAIGLQGTNAVLEKMEMRRMAQVEQEVHLIAAFRNLLLVNTLESNSANNNLKCQILERIP